MTTTEAALTEVQGQIGRMVAPKKNRPAPAAASTTSSNRVKNARRTKLAGFDLPRLLNLFYV